MDDLKIISVDDTLTNLFIIEEVARVIGYEVKSFEYPLEAYEYLENNEVDLMFVDYMMPLMNGLELIEKTKEVQPDTIPIMITAVTDNEELRKEALRLGVADFLTKPFDMEQLQAKIKHISNIKKNLV